MVKKLERYIDEKYEEINSLKEQYYCYVERKIISVLENYGMSEIRKEYNDSNTKDYIYFFIKVYKFNDGDKDNIMRELLGLKLKYCGFIFE